MRRSILMVSSVLMVACGPPPKTYVTLKVGAVIPRTGVSADESWGDALGLAKKTMNAALKKEDLKSIQFDIPIADDESAATVGPARALELVQNQQVKGLVSGVSASTLALLKTSYDADPANDLGVPVLSGAATASSMNNPATTNADAVTQAASRDADGWHFRLQMTGELVTSVMVRYLMEQGVNGDVNGDGKFKLDIYATNDAFGTSSARDLTTAATARTAGKIPLVIETIYHARDVNPDTYGWAADLDRLFDTINESASNVDDGEPDAVVAVLLGQYYVPVSRAYRGSGFQTTKPNTKLLYTWGFRISSVLVALGSAAEGFEGASPVLYDGASGDAFNTAFTGEFARAPVFRDAIFYDAGTMLMLATLMAAKDLSDPTQVTGGDVRQAMLKLNDPAGEVVNSTELEKAIRLIKAGTAINYTGASGPLDFDANRNQVQNVALFKVEGGAYVDKKKYGCVASPDCAPY